MTAISNPYSSGPIGARTPSAKQRDDALDVFVGQTAVVIGLNQRVHVGLHVGAVVEDRECINRKIRSRRSHPEPVVDLVATTSWHLFDSRHLCARRGRIDEPA